MHLQVHLLSIHISTFNMSLVTVMKLRIEENYHKDSMFLFYFLEENYLRQKFNIKEEKKIIIYHSPIMWQ
jgi:hypothetical protein